MGILSYNEFSRTIQGPPRALQDLPLGTIKFMVRAVSCGLVPNYNRNVTKQDLESELKRRKGHLKV